MRPFYNLLQCKACVLLFLLTLFCFSEIGYSQQLAFPSAYGAGAYVTGGRGQTVYHVTNTDFNDSPGSFKWAFEEAVANNGGTIVFDVSGVITIQPDASGRYRVDAGGGIDTKTSTNISILGQTAPFPGITIDNSNTYWEPINVHNIIFRYIKFRGSGQNGFLNMRYCDEVIMDHCSFAWSAFNSTGLNLSTVTDHNLDGNSWTPTGITLQNCFLSHIGRASNIGNTSGSDDAPFGEVSLLRNVYTNTSYRTPIKHGGDGEIDIINNFIESIQAHYGARMMRFDNQDFYLNHIGNSYSTGYHSGHPNFNGNDMHKVWAGNANIEAKIYQEDNYYAPEFQSYGIGDYDNDPSSDWGPFQDSADDVPDSWFVDTPRPLNGRAIPILSSSELKNELLPEVGSCKYINDNGEAVFYRDPIDTRYINDLVTGNNRAGERIPSTRPGFGIPQTSNSRPNNFYVSNDHIPEAYLISRGITGNATIHNEIQASGYTLLEEYANQVDGPPVPPVEAEGVTITPDAITLNVPESTTLTETFTPANTSDQTGTWASSNPLVAVVNQNGEVNSLTPGVTTITFTSNDGGFTAESEITVTNIVIPLLSILIDPSEATLEVGESADLNVTFVPANTTDSLGTWSSNDETIATVDDNGTVTTHAEGEVIITYTSNVGGLTVSSNITVIDTFYGSYQLYNADTDIVIQEIFGDTSVNLQNEGDQINFRSIPEGGDANPNVESVFVTWTGPTSGNFLQNVPLYSGLNGHDGLDFEPYTVVAGTYDFTISYYSDDDADGNLVAVDTFSITFFFDDLPIANAGLDQDICEGETITLTASGGANFLWNTGETTASIEVSPTTTTTYTVTVSDNEGNSDEDSVTVTVNPIPIANAGIDQSICEGESITLTASGGTSYIWSTGETSQSIDVNPNTTTTYNVEAISNGCSSSDSVTISVLNAPNLTLTNDTTIVEGTTTTLTVSGGDNYQWSTGETTATIEVSPNQTTTYSVTSNGVNGCSTTMSVTVTVEAVFQADAGEDQSACQNDNAQIVLTANEGDTYLWSTGATTQSITVSPQSTSTYTVTINSGIQQDTDEVTVFINLNPNVTIANGDSVDIMNGDFVTLSASGANSYLWNNGATQPNIAVSPSQTTTFEVEGFIGDCSDQQQIVVNVIPEVEADAGEDVEICLGDEVTLTASGGDEYVWSTGEETQSIQVSPNETTEYTVTVFNALDFDEDSVIVEVDANCEEDSQPEVPDEPLDFAFDIFPNPASQYVDVKLSGSVNLTRVYLYDITGKLIQYRRIANESLNISSTTRIDVSSLHPGMYYVKLIDIRRNISKKLIVR